VKVERAAGLFMERSIGDLIALAAVF